MRGRHRQPEPIDFQRPYPSDELAVRVLAQPSSPISGIGRDVAVGEQNVMPGELLRDDIGGGKPVESEQQRHAVHGVAQIAKLAVQRVAHEIGVNVLGVPGKGEAGHGGTGRRQRGSQRVSEGALTGTVQPFDHHKPAHAAHPAGRSTDQPPNQLKTGCVTELSVPVTVPNNPPDEPELGWDVAVVVVGVAGVAAGVELDDVEGAGLVLASVVVDDGVDDVLWAVTGADDTAGADGLVTAAPAAAFGWLVTPWPPVRTTVGVVFVALFCEVCDVDVEVDVAADDDTTGWWLLSTMSAPLVPDASVSPAVLSPAWFSSRLPTTAPNASTAPAATPVSALRAARDLTAGR